MGPLKLGELKSQPTAFLLSHCFASRGQHGDDDQRHSEFVFDLPPVKCHRVR